MRHVRQASPRRGALVQLCRPFARLVLGRVLADQPQMGAKPSARVGKRWKGDGAVRVNMESDLRTSGRLGKLARTMGWSEQRTGGALWFFYWHTQEAGIIEDTPDKIVSAVVVDFDSEGEAHAFVSGMVSAKLATISENGIVRIHGNDKHVERIERFKGNASELGKKSWEARKKKLNEIQTGSFSTGNAQEQGLNAQGTLLSPSSLLLSPIQNTNTVQAPNSVASPSADAPAAESASSQKKPGRPKRSAEQQARSKEINRRYRELYTKAEGHEPTGLDQAFNGIMAKFADKHADNAAAILDWFFASPDPYFKRVGWDVKTLATQAPRLWRELNDPKGSTPAQSTPPWKQRPEEKPARWVPDAEASARRMRERDAELEEVKRYNEANPEKVEAAMNRALRAAGVTP